MKIVGYLIFAAIYYIFRLLFPIKNNKIFCIMTHDSSRDGNVGRMVQYLRSKDEDYTFAFLHRADRNQVKEMHKIKGKLNFFFVKPYHLATSQYVMLDNTFLPMAFIRFKKTVSVVQLWHGTGTIKKFGQDVNEGLLKWLEKKANGQISHLIVNSEKTKKIYSRAFGVSEDKVLIYGLPRTDIFFNPALMAYRKEQFYIEYPNLQGKKLVLYAPTFRDSEGKNPKLALDLQLWQEKMPEDYVLLLRLHPFVADEYEKTKEMSKDNSNMRIISMSSYEEINTLLMVSDYLITDYSSIIFDYCILKKPMIFYAYDYEEFSNHGRGFYEEYDKLVPGPVVRDTESVTKAILQQQFDLGKVEKFIRENYQYIDGKAAERLYIHIFKE